MEDGNEKPKYLLYRTDEFVVKFLAHGKRGVNVLIQKRRNERIPGTLSLYEIPLFECNMEDLMEEFVECAGAMVKAMVDHSQNAEDVMLSRKREEGHAEERGKKVPDNRRKPTTP